MRQRRRGSSRTTIVAAGILTLLVGIAPGQERNPDAPVAPPAAPRAAAEAKSLESLLNESNFAYKKMADGKYRVTVEAGGTISIVIAYETPLWKDANNQDVKLIFLYRWIADMPEGFEVPNALYAKICEINDKRQLGRAMLNQYGIYYASDFWLRTADHLELEDEFIAAHFGAEFMAKELTPFLKGE